ncbi:ABC transporter permease [Bradyrhizobium sp. Arg237L]|uniref:ABC transporter permease n=1 Tax=Bradyrhizobium sp. Arg237L TaxID=3003352 RepID=UPI00249DBFBC|nr:ABC transporter permease [Bradyrhizobium sp. Arg237L]MDI4234084.1 ABC transporter permease [Bradyrhizobium sp. Arg237L]
MALTLSRNTVAGIVGTLVFFGAWEALSRSGLVNNVMLPAPSTIAQSGWSLLVDGELARHLGASLLRAAIGFVGGSVLAVALGVAMARLPLLHGTINPLVQMFRAVPSLAFVPLAIFWFGIGEASKIVLIAWGVFFPVWVNAYIGVRDTNPLLGRAAASLGARGWRNFVYVVIPGALPFIIAGLRVSLSVALVVLVAAELAGAAFGVGYLIQMSQQVFRVDQMFVGLITLGAMGFAADFLFERAVRRLLPWYGAEKAGQKGGQTERTRPA